MFFDCAKSLECIKPPCDISIAHMNLIQFIKLGMSMKDANKAIKEYGKQSMEDFTNRLQIITLERFLKITLIATSLPSPLLHRMLFIQVIQQLFQREVLLAWLVECLQNLNPWVANYI